VRLVEQRGGLLDL